MSAATLVPATAAAQTVTFSVSKMDCAACSGQIMGALMKTPGVYDARVDFDGKRATVRYDAQWVSVSKLLDTIDAAGFPETQIISK